MLPDSLIFSLGDPSVGHEKLLRLITIFDSSEEAETLINTIRNDGYIVRDIHVEDAEDLQTALVENPIDLVLAKNTLTDFSAHQVLELIHRSERDIPVIVIIPANDEQSAIDILNAGARDVVTSEQKERLIHIITREAIDLKARRMLRRSEKMLYENEKRNRDLIDNSRDAIAYVHDGMHIYANSAYLKLFGQEDLEDIQGLPIMDMVSIDDHTKFKEFLRAYAQGKTSDDRLEVSSQPINGHKVKLNMEFSSASMEGEKCTQIIIRDPLSSKDMEKKLSVLSKQDLLTGLYNRTYFMEQIDKYISYTVEGKSRGALLYIAIDNHNKLKSDLGISGSDLLISDIAKTLKEKLEKMGILARFEGAVFTMLLQNAEVDHAEKFAAGICKLIHDHTSDIGGQPITITASIGISLINESVRNLQECLRRAESACQAAQREGGGCYHLYSPSVEDMAEKEKITVWAQRIKDALKNNMFQLAFQPIVSLHGEPGAHYEVLVRMLGDSGDELLPTDFIPMAEEAGLVNYIDRWVIANTFMVLAGQAKKRMDTRFFIKLSGNSICDENLLLWISERIKSLRINVDNVVFEISEEVALNHKEQTKVFIKGLRELHCRCAIENFGIEQNTFHSIKHLDINYIKIHSDLVKELSQNIDHQEKIKAISEEVGARNIQIIAAFVEDANSLAILWQCSVDFIQGYFLQRPDVDLTYDFDEGL